MHKSYKYCDGVTTILVYANWALSLIKAMRAGLE